MDWYYWIILIIVLTIIELSTINLVSIWYIISAIISLILSLFINNIFILLANFVVLGTILLIFTKPLVKKYLNSNKICTNADRVIGMKAICTEVINKNNIGEVKVDGKRWSAISSQKIEKDEICLVEKIDGVKLIVKREENN